jgi:hypothetical protein
MNSSSIGITTFKTSLLTRLYCILDEYGCLGDDPRNHDEWENFVKNLKIIHPDEISGILILSYKKVLDGIDDDTFAMMLLPIFNKSVHGDKFMEKVFNYQKGRTIVSFVQL